MLQNDRDESLLEELIFQLTRLPSIGRKTAQRLAYHLLNQKPEAVTEFARVVVAARQKIHACRLCGNYTEADSCRICRSERRLKTLICVVEKPSDILAFERSGTYQGVYHVLGGSISPLDGIGPQDLNLEKLVERCDIGEVELILALNTNSEGETTSMYIQQKLKGKKVKVSRLARGIPVGSELDYVDELTMQRALEERVDLDS